MPEEGKEWSNISLKKVASKWVKVENGTVMLDLNNILRKHALPLGEDGCHKGETEWTHEFGRKCWIDG